MKKIISLILVILTVFSSLTLWATARSVLTAEKYENGMENWAGSPNKGEFDAVTQILFMPRFDGQWRPDLFYPELPVTVTMESGDFSKTFDARIATVYSARNFGICRIEPCLLEGINKFVPEKNRYYDATFTMSIEGDEYSVTVSDYVLNVDPIDPDPYSGDLCKLPLFDPSGDGKTDIADITALLDGLAAGAVASGHPGDTNGDGLAGIEDVTLTLDLLTAGNIFERNAADDGWVLKYTAAISGTAAIPDSYRGEPVTALAPELYKYCFALKTLDVPASVTWIPKSALYGCSGLSGVHYAGRESTFIAGSVRLPADCALVCDVAEDPMDLLDRSRASAISDLGGYGGILRVKTTGELLFSPNLNELRSLVSSGRRYDEFEAYLRFSDPENVYPTVIVCPQKSKGGWVDFFLQGNGIDCGFCPTAGVTYDIEFALTETALPRKVLYYGNYTATAGDDFADSVYYAPTPADQGGERTYVYRVSAGKGGSVEGAAVQYLTKEDQSTAVTALPDEGYEFLAWSDGVAEMTRSGDKIEKNTLLTAYFAEIAPVGNLAKMYIITSDGQPILSKEDENAYLLIRGASNDKYNVTLPMTVKGRGNSSWNGSAPQTSYDSKNSYSIKLEEKAQLLGVGDSKNKKWVLNSNKFDLSGLRNYLVWELADRMGTIGYVTDCTWVQLYVNAEYRGMYMLTEKIDTGKDRVNVDDGKTGDPDKGYLMELDFRGQSEEDPWFDIEGYGPDPANNRYDAVEFVIKSDIEGQQDVDFIRDYVQRCHNAIMTGDRDAIDALVDIPSLIDMYIIEELSKDCDAGRASFYVCKDKGGKLFFTAPWDFDFGFGTYGPATSTDGLVSKGGDCCTWFARLIGCTWFTDAVKNRMSDLLDELEDTVNTVRATGAFLKEDADRNAEFWNMYGTHFHAYVSGDVSRDLTTYDEHIDFIANWTYERWRKLYNCL
ncbi:MAG: CotH kinase family protein [Clostridia bacterium]|nr:CotH kinase family protein [Clostridia bacterium]